MTDVEYDSLRRDELDLLTTDNRKWKQKAVSLGLCLTTKETLVCLPHEDHGGSLAAWLFCVLAHLCVGVCTLVCVHACTRVKHLTTSFSDLLLVSLHSVLSPVSWALGQVLGYKDERQMSLSSQIS